MKYSYDDLGRTVAVSNMSSNYAIFTCNADDSLRSVTFGNGLVGNYTYDRLGRPSFITLKNDGITLLYLSYSYYNTGTVSNITGTLNGVSLNEQYSYDDLLRLTDATVTTGTTTNMLHYSYDVVGNRLSQETYVSDPQCGTAMARTDYTYDYRNNRLTSDYTYRPIYPSGPCSFVRSDSYNYDNNGNLRSRNTNATSTDSWAYTWNPDGRLVKVATGSTTKGAYGYDGLGRRVKTVEGSTTAFYAYLGTETLYEKAGESQTDYVYASGLRIARVSDGTTSYYHTDHLGSTRLVTSSTRMVVFSDSYQPFGLDNVASGSETYKFTGKPYSSSIGLYYSYQRWYDPSWPVHFQQT